MRNKVQAPTARETYTLKILILLGLFSVVHFLFFFFEPEHRGNNLLYILLSITILYSIFKKLYMWYNYANISVPKIPKSSPDLKVDILTTYFPGEPYQMIVTTLEAITQITYPHTAYLCDEGNDPFLKEFCKENGIIHVTRKDRKDAKAGNINNALQTAATGDICVVLDPDHIPEPDFLDHIVPFFSDPQIGFVQIVQSYYNTKETLVARGAAEQTFQFYGPMMMTLHSYGTVNAIGANCVFRRKALDSIGGHAPGLCEDMHTAMRLYSKGWKAVYLPEVLAKGLAPSNLTTYFKQQLKWARGTFDLLFKVYPKLFSSFNVRQKIHFGILPLHYLSGVIYFINFLIPVLALLLSTTPWKGNIVDFILAILPLVCSAILIRTFVQKWVIEKEERGFHITGGLLQINTWWVYILGLLYTIFDKDVPYLPTSKESEFNTNLQIVLPNAVVALISIFAIIYGLEKDLTPFSIFMAGFAFFNTCIMLFGIYLAVKVTNQNRILSTRLNEKGIKTLYSLKESLRGLFHAAFTLTRKTALPLLGVILLVTLSFIQHKENHRWQQVEPSIYEKKSGKYLGVFYPQEDHGLTDLDAVNSLEARQDLNFDIISFYLAWDEENVKTFPFDLMENIAAKNAIPMITWEPWASLLPEANANPLLKEEKKMLEHISQGVFDSYIKAFADKLAEYDRPVYLRFAHEFDNPQYPWSKAGGNTPEEFKAAWKHVFKIIKARGAHEVMMVWNPWSSEGMQKYYPGDQYVDWIGVTALNYQNLNQSGNEKSLQELYTPFHEKLFWFTRKPVMLAEFGSLNLNGNQAQWMEEAAIALEGDFPEVEAVVLFYSGYDNNIPGSDYEEKYLDWRVDSLEPIKRLFDTSPVMMLPTAPTFSSDPDRHLIEFMQGVRYKKGIDWKDNYYVLTRNQLLEDLVKMKDAGMNTVQFKGGNVYEYNILKYTEEHDLEVIYQFDIDLSKSFLSDRVYIRKLEEDIIEKVRDLKNRPHVTALNFDFNLDFYYTKPLLFYQKQAYIEWLHFLFKEIRSIAPEKAILVDLPLKASTPGELLRLDKTLAADSYGLLLKDTTYFQQVKDFAEEKNIPFHLASIPARLLSEVESHGNGSIVENWQDERLSYRLSFDGLLDFSGRKKESYYEVAEDFGALEVKELSTIRIVKPAVPLLPGESQKYSAAFYFQGQWIHSTKLSEDLNFEWWLVKNDLFGNPLAAKKIGEGAAVSIKIPEDYKSFNLLLNASKAGSEEVSQHMDVLYTPLYQPVVK